MEPITIQVSDGTTTDKITVNVTVTSVDDSPFTNKKLSDVNATENDPDLSIDLTGLFGDIDNEPSEIILSADSSNSSVVSANVVQNGLFLISKIIKMEPQLFPFPDIQ